jgi:multidrug efflux pump subunit AcrB
VRSQVATYADDRLAAAGATTGDALVVRVYGQDLKVLQTTAEEVRQRIQTVSGVVSPTMQPMVSEPAIDIQVDLAAAQRVGLAPGDVRRDVATLVSGLTVGSLYEQQAIFDVVVWGGAATRDSVAGLQSLLLDTPDGVRVRLGDVAKVRVAAEPSAITHDAVARSLDITAAISGRSAADVAAAVTAQLRKMDFPYEYRAEVVGDAVSRADTRRWILITILAVAVVAYLLLQSALASWRGAALLMLVVPFAAVGALIGAQLTGGVLTGGVLVAVFTVVALALRQALVLVRRAQGLCEEGVDPADAMRQAVRDQAPGVTGVALATAVLFLPAAVMGGGAGLELLHPFAVSLLAGLISATVVVLLVVPGVYPALAGLQRAPGELDPPAGPDDPPDQELAPQTPPAVPAARSDIEKENEGVR